MIIQDKILADLKTAMKQQNQTALITLRSLKAKLMEAEISERKDGHASLDDHQVLAVIMKAAKQRKESITQFEAAARQDLADKEKAELAIIESYMPEMASDDDIRKVVGDIIQQTGASSVKDMGKVMGAAMGRFKGKADGTKINEIVKSLLS